MRQKKWMPEKYDNAERQRKFDLVDYERDGDPGGVYVFRTSRTNFRIRWVGRESSTYEQLRELFPDVWCDVEFPHNVFGMRYWLKLFKTTGFVTDEPGLVKPDEQLTVYRGCTLETRWRLSWTTDLGRAEWFAARLKLVGYAGTTVYSTDVPPRHVLGLIQRRNEHEVVVNPYGLRNWTALGMSALPAGEVYGS